MITKSTRTTTPAFIVVKSKKSRTAKRDAETTLKKEESSIKRFQNRNDMPKDICQIYSNWEAGKLDWSTHEQ